MHSSFNFYGLENYEFGRVSNAAGYMTKIKAWQKFPPQPINPTEGISNAVAGKLKGGFRLLQV